MTRRSSLAVHGSLSLLAALIFAAALGLTAPPEIPAHPDRIQFAPLKFEPPDRTTFRHTLGNGVAVYLAPSSEFPLINVSFSFRGGQYLDPPDKIGLAAACGAMIRRGGSVSLTGQQLDEEFDFLAAQASSVCGDVDSHATLNALKSNFDRSLDLFMDMLRNPRFQQDRLDVYKAELIESMKQRNDDAGPLLAREWSALLYGRDHFESAQPTLASVQSITASDLRAMHRRIFHPAPGHVFIAVTGDFEPQQMLARLSKAMESWQGGPPIPVPPTPTAAPAPGLYHVEKDIPQGKVYVGVRAIRRDDPDYVPMLVMNYILGGGGFTSRITTRVRTEEGLAYAAGSVMLPRVEYPGEWRAGFRSKNATVALALKLVLAEMQRLANEPVSQDELETAKNAFVETFPRLFESKAGMLALFVDDEMTGRPTDYWKTYRDRIRAVSAQDVQRVAQKYLQPQAMAILVVGRWDQIAAGDLQHRAAMSEFFGGRVTHLPLRDPLTLEPMK